MPISYYFFNYSIKNPRNSPISFKSTGIGAYTFDNSDPTLDNLTLIGTTELFEPAYDLIQLQQYARQGTFIYLASNCETPTTENSPNYITIPTYSEISSQNLITFKGTTHKSFIAHPDYYTPNDVKVYIAGNKSTNKIGFLINDLKKNEVTFIPFTGQYQVSAGIFSDENYGSTSTANDTAGTYEVNSENVKTSENTLTYDKKLADGTTTTVSVNVNTPTISGVDTGFITAWRVTKTQLQSLGTVLWSSDFVDSLVKSVTNPMDTVISLNIIPSIGEIICNDDATENIYLGSYNTKVLGRRIYHQYFTVDMGYYTFSEYWASALDYDPYTNITLYLPYIGMYQLSADDVMGRTIHVVYNCDCISGALIALIYVSTDSGETLLYTQTGNFSMTTPVTANDYSQIYKGLLQASIQTTASLGTAVATGGAAVGGAVDGIAKAVGDVVSSKINYPRSGNVSTVSGYLGVQRCYVIISRPVQSLPDKYNTFNGYPSNITATLSDLRGFTAVEDIHLENVIATDDEKNEIITLLKQGVII
jgi:hypothetical protein